MVQNATSPDTAGTYLELFQLIVHMRCNILFLRANHVRIDRHIMSCAQNGHLFMFCTASLVANASLQTTNDRRRALPRRPRRRAN